MQSLIFYSSYLRKKHLVPYLPTHPIVPPEGTSEDGSKPFGVISAAPYGSSAILTIPWAYIKMMGPKGLRKASQVHGLLYIKKSS